MDNLMFSVQLGDVSTRCSSHPQGKVKRGAKMLVLYRCFTYALRMTIAKRLQVVHRTLSCPRRIFTVSIQPLQLRRMSFQISQIIIIMTVYL